MAVYMKAPATIRLAEFRCDLSNGGKMRAADVIEYLRQTPFVPFRIHVTDGTIYEIRHPELVKVGMTKADVFFPKDDTPHAVVLRRESVALVHMVRIEPLEKAGLPGSNGQASPTDS
jgi:hypothetical protein